MDVVAGLDRHPGEVDRVHREEVGAAAEGFLDHRLAVVEGPIHSEHGHHRVVDGGHLPPLHLGDPALGVEDDDGEPPPTCLDGGGAGVAAGGDQHGAIAHLAGEEAGHHLEGMVLEAERRPPEQLEHHPVVDGDDRGDLRVGEGRRRLRDDGVRVLAPEGPEHSGHGLDVAPRLPAVREPWCLDRRVEAAVGGQAVDQGAREVDLRRGTGGTESHRFVVGSGSR
jgi:hypothetical protein